MTGAFACQPVAEEQVDYAAEHGPIMEAYITAWSTGDYALLDEGFSPNVRRDSPGLPGDADSLEELKEVMENFRSGFSDTQVVLDWGIYEVHRSVHHWTFAGTNDGPIGDIPATGVSVEVSGMTYVTYEDGKVVEEVVYFDNLGFMEQLGFTLTPPEPEEGEVTEEG
jgi:steroid delta-isomerase-like uncharacterized protein